MASAGAAVLVKITVSRTSLLSDTWINRKPFSCPLCMGFWMGSVIRVQWTGWAGWFDVVFYGLQAAAFSWFFYWKITGDE